MHGCNLVMLKSVRCTLHASARMLCHNNSNIGIRGWTACFFLSVPSKSSVPRHCQIHVLSPKSYSGLSLRNDGSRSKSRDRSSRGRVGVAGIRSMAESQKSEQDDPSDFRYIQLWVSEDGESHIKDCKMTGFTKQAYSSLPQFVREEFGGKPTSITFTELSVGLEQPLHTCPQVQFVITLSGSWYIKTTDGAKHVFKPGEVLFQDNTADTPAKSTGEHLSGVVGDVPCQQLIVQFDRPPEVDNPNPF